LPDAREARNVVISDDKVRELIAAAYRLDHQLGLLTDTLAVTGARPSQAVRLLVEDLHHHPLRPKLMMPKSAKGGGRNRSVKKTERYSVPITTQLAAKLKAAAKGRADDVPLLLQSDGTPWNKHPGQSPIWAVMERVFAEVEGPWAVKKLTGKSEPVFDAAIPPPRLALSILEFCDAHGISEAFYYKLKKKNEGPCEMKVGARTLISFESAAEWRRAREAQHSRGHRERGRSVHSGEAHD
jgi:hypothetical protein